MSAPLVEDAGEQPMVEWEHNQSLRDYHDTLQRTREILAAIRAEVGDPPRSLRSNRVVIQLGEDRRVHWYVPNLGVAGSGRCTCEAALEAMAQFETILESVREHRDWGILPAPDRSAGTLLRVVKTDLYLSLLDFVTHRIGPSDAHDGNDLKGSLAGAF